MTTQRSKFAGGDQAYLQQEQYADSSRLAARANVHEKYSSAAVPWFDWVGEQFSLFEGARVLEVGCGAGWLWAETSVVIPAGVDLTLSDYSPGMVDEAVERATGTQRLASVSGRQADLQELPFDSASFDRAIANHMLYHLPDPAKGVAELARVVTPDGLVIAATNGERHMAQLGSIRHEIFGVNAADATIEAFGAETGHAMLRDHFRDVQWQSFDDELRCTDPADVVAYLCSTPPGEDATADQLARLEAAVARAFANGDGTMVISKDVGCFTARTPL